MRAVYEKVHLEIVKSTEADPTAWTELRLEPYLKTLRVEFNALGLDPTSQVRQPNHQIHDSSSKRPAAKDAELKQLRALVVAPLPSPTPRAPGPGRRGKGRGGGPQGASTRSGRGPRTPDLTAPCFCCGTLGCRPSTCPKSNPAAKQHYAAIVAARESRNAVRSLLKEQEE